MGKDLHSTNDFLTLKNGVLIPNLPSPMLLVSIQELQKQKLKSTAVENTQHLASSTSCYPIIITKRAIMCYE